jgi:hypothetical protein
MKVMMMVVMSCISVAALASDLLMVRTQLDFPEAMLALQTSVKEHGYSVTRVQRIDIGLTGMGYKTDKYRIVFVGKPNEIQYLINKYPVLAASVTRKIKYCLSVGKVISIQFLTIYGMLNSHKQFATNC